MSKKSIIYAGILLGIIALIVFGAIMIGYDHNLDEIPDPGYRLGSDEVFMQIFDVSIDGLNNQSIVIESEEDLEAAFHVYRELDIISDLDKLLDTYPLEENVLYISFYWERGGVAVTPHAMVVVPETNSIYMDCNHSGGNSLSDVEPDIVEPCTLVALIPKEKVERLDFSEYKSYYITGEYENSPSINDDEWVTNESYHETPDAEDIVYEEENDETYVRNQLVVGVMLGTDKKLVDDMTTYYGATVVGYISGMEMYQIEFDSEMSYSDLEELIDEIESYPFVTYAMLNYVDEMEQASY